MANKIKHISKYLSLVLRHNPSAAGVSLDAAGWVEIDALLAGATRKRQRIDRATLDAVVAENDKNRFEISEDGARIRARQGHSVPVDLGLEAVSPPETLYHGTVERFLDAILQEGLKPQQRHHVHLSETVDTATAVGARRGKPVILSVDATGMAREGYAFFVSSNGVWLVDAVPPGFITVPDA